MKANVFAAQLAFAALLVTGPALAQRTRGRPEPESGRLEFGLGLGAGASAGGSDVRGAIRRAGFSPEDRHHALVPFASMTFRTTPNMTVGLEASGVRGYDVHSVLDGVQLTETVGGRIVSLIARFGNPATDRRRLVFGVGGGIDSYRIDVASFFDPQRNFVDSSSKRMQYVPWGAQVNGDARFYVVRNVAIRLYVAAHVVSPVRTKSIAFGEERFLPSHNVRMSWAVAGVGVALHY